MPDVDPGLAAALEGGTGGRLGRRLTLTTISVAAGQPLWPEDGSAAPDLLGILLLDGPFLRRSRVGGGGGAELLGQGDFLALASEPPSSLSTQIELRALVDSRVGRVEGEIARFLSAKPSAMRELLRRTQERSRRLAAQAAISAVHPLPDRLHHLFWHLADSWGRRVDGQVEIDAPFTHEVLAALCASNRETVSRALALLETRQVVERLSGKRLGLLGPPPDSVTAVTKRNGNR